MTEPTQASLRAATLGDAMAITEFLTRLGLVMPDGEDAIRAHWDALWRSNPALKHHGDDPALGWVLDDKGHIAGFFGNIPQVSYFNGKPVVISSARAWAVDKPYRSQTRQLCEAFFGQTGADVVLISSANAPAGKRCLEFGGSAMPQPGYGEILYWVLDAGGFLRAGLKKKGYGGFAAFWGGLLGAVVLNARMRLGGQRPFAPLDGITIKTLDEIDKSFDALWQRKLDETPGRLLACRDAETLRWYFGLSQSSADTRVICLERDGRLDGYAVVVREDAPAIGLRRLKIADLFIAGDDLAAADALLTAAYEYGLAKRCHVLEVIGLADPLRNRALHHKPFLRPMAVFPFYFKALKAELVEPLASADGWSVTAYDGDTALL
ncbi:MAG: hypothetical protein ISR51_08460 [Rhodospirillales bacterium]|nr:hypothetical protein [Rhodospirillales bacterium]